MNIEKSTTIAFTGHRKITSDIRVLKSNLLQEIENQYQQGYRTFMSGMAMGFDLLSAECVLEMREKYTDIKLICVIPFSTQYKMYNNLDRARWSIITIKADDCRYISETYFKMCFFFRNEYLVNHSSKIIAYFDGQFKSGTAQTIRRAEANSLPIINLYNI